MQTPNTEKCNYGRQTAGDNVRRQKGNNPDTHYYLAQHYLNFGELDKAQVTLEEALKLGLAPVTAYVLFELVQLGRFNKANNYIDQLHHFLTQTNNLRLKMVCLQRMKSNLWLINQKTSMRTSSQKLSALL